MSSKTTVRIGLFDSGIGGLSVLYQLIKLLPHVEYFYIADQAYAPYGEKTSDEIDQRALFLTDLFLQRQCDAVVVACNTATATSVELLRRRFPQVPIVGVEPYLTAMQRESLPADARLGVLTTVLTQMRPKFINLKKGRDPANQIKAYTSRHLAMLVEEAYAAGEVTPDLYQKIKAEISFLKSENLSHLILGCTHYPLVREVIERVLGVQCLCSEKYVAKQVESKLVEYKKLVSEDHLLVAKSFFWFMSTKSQDQESNQFKKISYQDVPLWPKSKKCD